LLSPVRELRNLSIAEHEKALGQLPGAASITPEDLAYA
jgi:hypothetical protein